MLRMRKEQLETLAAELGAAAERSPVAVTITLPTHRRAPDNAQDPVRVRKGARRAVAALDHVALDRSQRRRLTERLEALTEAVEDQVGFASTDLGLACYVTTELVRVVPLAHTPPERVILSDAFSLAAPIADLVAADDVDVLVLSTGGGATDGARLYRLERGELTEDSGGVFPLSWDVRDRDRSYATAIESDKRDALIEGFLRRINAGLLETRGGDRGRQLVLVGIRRLRDHWRRVAPSQLLAMVVAEVEGNVDRVTMPELCGQVSAAVSAAAESRALRVLDELAAMDRAKVATVADDVHVLCDQGRVRRLLVEEAATDEVSVDGVVLADRVALTLRRAYDTGATIVVMPEGSLAASPLTGGGRLVAELRW
jgi:hypothetical protein